MENIKMIANSPNIAQFGFSTTFNLENRTIELSIGSGLTVFKGSGATVTKIYFEVKDPSGLRLAVINYDEPPHIDPTVKDFFVIDLPNGFAQFGYFLIKGVIKDADGKVYPVEFKKNVCKPKGFKKDCVAGKFDVVPNCDMPKISFYEVTDFSYGGKSPIETVKDGVVYYPKGTLADVPFSFTPFEIAGSGKVYTGGYTVRNKTIATYDLGDMVYVVVSYKTSKDFSVECNSNLCRVLCCIMELEEKYRNNGGTEIGRDAKRKLDEISVPLYIATARERCGKSAEDYIAQIEKIIGCDCGCGSESVEPKLLLGSGSGSTISVEGECATTVTPQVSGDTMRYVVKTKSTTIGDNNKDLSYYVTTVAGQCNTDYTLWFNYPILAETILNTIRTDEALSNIFNQIVNAASGIDLSGLDGKCILKDFNKCDYTLIEVVDGRVIDMTGVIIDGQVYNAGAISFDQPVGAIKEFLSSLDLGDFQVTWDNSTKSIMVTSHNNTHTVNALLLHEDVKGGGENSYSKAFVKSCKTFADFLQAVIDYVCSLTIAKIALGEKMILCKIVGGELKQIPYEGDVSLLEYIKGQNEALCALATTIQTLKGLDCTTMKTIFPATSKKVIEGDVLYGTKEAACAGVTYKEIADKILHVIFSDTELKEYFCAQIATCGQPGCTPVSNISVQLIQANDEGEFSAEFAESFNVINGGSDFGILINAFGLGDATAFTIGYRLYGSGDPFVYIEPEPTALPFLITNVPNGRYEISIAKKCANGVYSNPIFGTSAGCPVPISFAAQAGTDNDFLITYQLAPGQTTYDVELVSPNGGITVIEGSDGNSAAGISIPAPIILNGEWTLRLRGKCVADIPSLWSDWSNPIGIFVNTQDICPQVLSASFTNITPTGAVITAAVPNNQPSTIGYTLLLTKAGAGPLYYTQAGYIWNVNNLEANTLYSVYIVTNCAGGLSSSPKVVGSFTTAESTVVSGGSASNGFNPSNGAFTISVDTDMKLQIFNTMGQNGAAATIVITDTVGGGTTTQSVDNSTANPKSVTFNMPAGSYTFVLSVSIPSGTSFATFIQA
jgi:hypothetical protein